MDAIKPNLENWKASLLSIIPVGGLLARNEVAHKWKAPFRCMMLREAASWRTQDLLEQSYDLHQQGHGLGARILLRSAFETLATLVYLNQLMQQVLDGQVDFHVFSHKTAILLMGSRNRETEVQSINIVTVLEKCDKRYPGLMSIYADLSESTHPNWEGLCWGYSKVDHVEYETVFSNRWTELFAERHLGKIELCMKTFMHEYNDVWPALFDKMETWIEANDVELEATRSESAQST